MVVDISTLEPNQQEWLRLQELLRETYSWLGEIGEVPDEQKLEIYKKCPVTEFNTSCFAKGNCINSHHPRCTERK